MRYIYDISTKEYRFNPEIPGFSFLDIAEELEIHRRFQTMEFTLTELFSFRLGTSYLGSEVQQESEEISLSHSHVFWCFV